jgi:DNA transformation protein
MPATTRRCSDSNNQPAASTSWGLPGLGPKSEAMLQAAGIRSVGRLKQLGAARAFVQVQVAGYRPSLNLLWALDGALTAQPWRQVARLERTRLLLEVDDLRSRSDPWHP